jgi:hypothetical protein
MLFWLWEQVRTKETLPRLAQSMRKQSFYVFIIPKKIKLHFKKMPIVFL